MKIWYQSLTRESLFSSYQAVLKDIVEHVRSPSTQIDIYPITRVGGLGKQFHYLEHLQTTEVLDNVEKAVEQGYDGFVIGHFTDSGLHEAREIADIPIVGLGESSMLMACTMGKRFSLVGINDKSLSYIEDRVHGYGLNRRLASTSTMQLEGPSILEEALTGDAQACQHVITSFNAAARIAEQQGGEVIIPAGGVAMAVLVSAGIHVTTQGASVLNGIAAAVKTSEMAVQMNRLMEGHYTSKRLSYARPSPDEIPQIQQHYGSHIYRSMKTD